MNKILTIVVPTYNMEKYLHKCLDSLIVSKENMECLEVLVVNDGSKDSSSQIAHEYETRYPQTFKVIDKENGNYGSCINRGLKEATGKYIKVLDADDNFDNKLFDLYIVFLKNTDVDLVISDYCVIDSQGDTMGTYTFPLPMDRSFSLAEMPVATIHWLWHQGIAYKTDLLREMNYQQLEGFSYTDEEWLFKPIIKVNTISYFPHILYLYLRGREGQTFDPKILKKEFDKRIVVLHSMIDFYQQYYERCSISVKRYLTEKLLARLIPIYNFYLIKNHTRDGNAILMEFDYYLKESCKNLWDLLNGVHSRWDLYYIQNWRKSGYSFYDISHLIMYIKFKIQCMIGLDRKDFLMPRKYKREI